MKILVQIFEDLYEKSSKIFKDLKLCCLDGTKDALERLSCLINPINHTLLYYYQLVLKANMFTFVFLVLD